MSRLLTGLAVGLLSAAASGQVAAADWGVPQEPVFKPAYPVDMMPYEDSLDFEAGIRYFYGMGGQRATFGGGADYTADDASHFIEFHGRIDDHSTNTYVVGNIGYAAVIDGTYETPLSGELSTDSGRIAYGGADFGYLPFKAESIGLGAFIGYQYLNESIDMGRSEFYTPSGGLDSEQNLLEVHGLRLGVTAQADVNDQFDVRIDAAAIPYASLSGIYGPFGASVDGINPGLGSAARISGHLYGGAAEAMVGFKATDNIKIRAGARGYYLTGPTETYYETRNADGSNGQGYVVEGDIELMRWGPFIELTGTF